MNLTLQILMLPMLILTTLLMLATVTDLRAHRIPNAVSLGGCILGLVLGTVLGGWAGLGAAAGGLAVGFFALIGLYAAGGMAAGDVKLMAAAGSFLGPWLAFHAVLYTFMAGAVLGIAYLVFKDGVRETFARYGTGIKYLITTRKWMVTRPDPQQQGPLRFPYALAIAIGSLTAALTPPLLG